MAPKIEPNENLVKTMKENVRHGDFLLDGRCRPVVERAIRNVCDRRSYSLFAIHVRTNHAHVTVSAASKPELVMNAFKANATRELREAGLVDEMQQVWSRGGSTRYLWKPFHVDAAISYVLYGQGDDLPDFI